MGKRKCDHPPIVHLHLGTHSPFGKITGLEVFALGPLSKMTIEHSAGEIYIRSALLAAGLRITTPKATHRASATAGAGIGLDTTFVHAKANPGRMAAQPFAVYGALFYGRFQLRVSLSRHVSMVASLLLGTRVPRVSLYVANRPATTLSKLIVSGLLGINVAFGKKMRDELK